MHMHVLLGTSHVVSKVVLAHSASQADLSVISHDGGGDDAGSKNAESENSDKVHYPKHYSVMWPSCDKCATTHLAVQLVSRLGLGVLLGVSALHYSTGSTEGSEGFGCWLQLMHCA